MKNGFKLAIVSALAPFVMSAVAYSARLEVLQSDVYLDRGQGFTLVSGSINSVVGLKILIKDGGKARIYCTETSMVTFESPGVYEIGDDCKAMSSFDSTVLSETGFSTTTAVVLGTAAVGVGVAIAVSGGDDDPASN